MEGKKAWMDILLVDDDTAFRTAVERSLTERGHEVRTARDGEEALCRLEEQRPRLVISDMEMPRMTGVELLIRVGQLYPDTPVILMTALGDAMDASTAFEHGAYGFLQKPLSLQSLLAGIRRLEAGAPGGAGGQNGNAEERG